MAWIQGNWVKVGQKGTGPGSRSSHAIAIVGQKAYAFGGEFNPRLPVDDKLYVFCLVEKTWSVTDKTGDVPSPRFGVTMASIGDKIYLFGGRDGTHGELNEFYTFNTRTNKWTLVSSGETGPDSRSYHSMAADDRCIYVFGGWAVSGRLNDLWSYDVSLEKWTELPAPGETCKPRGGPGLAVSLGKIWVVYGFSGEELDDVHCYDQEKEEWSLVETTGNKPSPRSVFSVLALGMHVFVYGGEVDPSDLGHLGAGKFAQEVFVLDTEKLVWHKLEDGENSCGEHPGPRGWCAFAGGQLDGEDGMLVYGGISPNNDRLGDIFFFSPKYAAGSL